MAIFHLAKSLPLRLECLGKAITKGECIFDVVMSVRFLVVVTSKRIITVDIPDDVLFEAVMLDAWECDGISCTESTSQLIVAVGKGRGNSLEASLGRIDLYRYEKRGPTRKLSLGCTVSLPLKDRPKRVSLSPDAGVLICVTTIQNKLLVWDLNEDLSPSEQPFEFLKYRFRKVSVCQLATST